MGVKDFARSISFPAPKQGSGHRAAAAKTSYRTRSTSLPTRLHPLAAHIDSELDAVLFWSSSSSAAAAPSAEWISDGLSLLEHLLRAFVDLLLLPQAQDPLRRLFRRRSRHSTPSFADGLLDDLLRLADAYNSFRSDALELRLHLSSTRAALRRSMVRVNEPGALLSSCVRAQRRGERDVARLKIVVRDVGRRLPVLAAADDEEEAEAWVVVREVMAAAAAASDGLFDGVAALSAASVAALPLAARYPWVKAALRWRERARRRLMMTKRVVAEEKEPGQRNGEEWQKVALQRLDAAEGSVATAENGGEKVFRALVNTRVKLLNMLTPSF